MVSKETADDIIKGQVGSNRTAYIAVDATNQLLGFIVLADYRKAPEEWAQELKAQRPTVFPDYFKLEVNPEALANQEGMGGYPQFSDFDAVQGVDTRVEKNKLASSLEIEFLCATNPSVKGIGSILIVHAMLEHINDGYYGLLLSTAPKVEPEKDLQKFPQTFQGSIPDSLLARVRTNAGLTSFYHRTFQFERSFVINPTRKPPARMTESDSRMWFYDRTYSNPPSDGNVYFLKTTVSQEIFFKGGIRKGARQLLPSNALMYRPYPTLEQIISFIGQIGATMMTQQHQRMEQ